MSANDIKINTRRKKICKNDAKKTHIENLTLELSLVEKVLKMKKRKTIRNRVRLFWGFFKILIHLCHNTSSSNLQKIDINISKSVYNIVILFFII